jgi:arginyl-tRNA synthetase
VKAEQKPKTKPAAALPLKPVAEELTFLRRNFRELIATYGANIEGDIARLQAAVSEAAASKRKLPASRVPELRDMLMMLRNFDVKPAKGRRRDLKKIENLVEDLQAIVEHWVEKE